MKARIVAVAAAVLTAAVVTSPAASAEDEVTHHEFQANCTVSHLANDDPIVFPGQPGGTSHLHAFLGNTGTDAHSTLESLREGETSCLVPADRSAYWFPTLLNGNEPVVSTWHQVVYYKSGIEDYTAVQPFPEGIRFVVGDPTATAEEFQNAPGAVEGFECGESFHNYTFPDSCDEGAWLNVRYQAPSCWDGVNLDSADHKSHMAYPVEGSCPASHPVPVPMLEFKIHFPISGDMSQVSLATPLGTASSWHYDFINAWEPQTLEALVEHCINGGLQCNSRGYDLYKPHRGAVLDEDYELMES